MCIVVAIPGLLYIGLRVLISYIDKSVESCMFVRLKCVCYLVDGVVMIDYVESFYVLVQTCG